METPRTYRQRSGASSARTDRSHRNRVSDTYQQLNNPRKSYSSKARVHCHVPDHSKKAANGAPSKQENDERNIFNQTAAHERLQPSSLISLVDDLDLSSSLEKSYGDGSLPNGDHGNKNQLKVFEFVSRPHSLPRETVADMKVIEKKKMSLSTSAPSQQDTRERIQEKINRITPTPRSATRSPKALRNMRELKSSRKHNPIRPPSSLSPDLSLSHSGHVYDSAKYSENLNFRPEQALVNKSIISLKSSDATLTESVDTLVQTSICADPNQDMQLNKDDSLYLPPNQVGAFMFISRSLKLVFGLLSVQEQYLAVMLRSLVTGSLLG